MDIQIEWLVPLTFALTLATGVLSGLTGGGAGFIVAPYYILIGLTPQQAVATGKLGGLGSSVGAVVAFKGKGLIDKRYIWPLLAITTTCALVSAWLIPQVDSALLQKLIGLALIVLTPTLFIERKSLQPGTRSQAWIIAGFVLYTLVSFAQTMMGSGIGTLLVLVLMFLFGLNALEANATKRVTQMMQAVILFVLLLVQGLVVVSHGVAALLGSTVGAHIGSRMAITRGTRFIKIMLAVVMVLSGVSLLVI